MCPYKAKAHVLNKLHMYTNNLTRVSSYIRTSVMQFGIIILLFACNHIAEDGRCRSKYEER
jgi:hypothetical protein